MSKRGVLIWTLLAAFLMPYLARLPGAMVYGADWFWSYLPDAPAFLFFSFFNLIPLLPVLAAGLLFVAGKVKWGFYASAITCLAATFYFHFDYDLASDAQAAIGLVFFPFLVFAVTLAVGLVASGADLAIERRRRRND